MTFRSRLPLHIYQKIFIAKDTYKSLISKIEVIADSRAILYSIRILIVAIALLMGYIHTSKNESSVETAQKKEMIGAGSVQSP